MTWLKNNLPHSLLDYCSTIQHNYSTRQKTGQQVHLPKLRTTQGQFSLSFVGSDLWNKIPLGIKSKLSRSTFRNSLKEHLLS